ncbi:MAG: hypothetical protein ACYTEX_23220 [Planctomycetota bacterium]|jgi:hypothetical protein
MFETIRSQVKGDATCDGSVNPADLFALKAHLGKSAPCPADGMIAVNSRLADELYSSARKCLL